MGKVTPAGAVVWGGMPGPTAELKSKINGLLVALATDPAKVAAEHGKLTGKCCFCNRKLDDKRSTEVGYGPICAEHYSLPWGEGAEKQSAKPAAAPLVTSGPWTLSVNGFIWDADASDFPAGEQPKLPDGTPFRLSEFGAERDSENDIKFWHKTIGSLTYIVAND